MRHPRGLSPPTKYNHRVMRSVSFMAILMAAMLLASCPAGDSRKEAGLAGDDSPVITAEDEVVTDVSTDPEQTASGDDLPFELPSPSPPGPATELATIAVTGNFRGFQKPCACTPEQEGGLARLGGLLHALDQAGPLQLPAQSSGGSGDAADISTRQPDGLENQPLWLLELGNFSFNGLHFTGLRSRTHLQVLAAIGGVAAIPGAAELSLPKEEAVRALAHSPLPLVSCNLATELDGIEIQTSLQLADNWHLVGVSSGTDNQGLQAQGDWWNLSDAHEAVLAVLDSLPVDCNVILAGANLDPQLAGEMLEDSRVQLCIGVPANYHRYNDAEPPMFRDPLPKATTLDIYSVDARDRKITAWPLVLEQTIPDDRRVMELIRHESRLTKERLLEQRRARAEAAGGGGKPEFGMSDRFLPPSEREFSFEDEPTYIGASQCQACHTQAYSGWQDSRHAQSFHSLEADGQTEMLDCLACHSTGLLEPGGYDPTYPEAEVQNVSCESCHGPGSHHVQKMLGTEGAPEGQLISREVVDGCIRCHDPYNSPSFERESYWEQIAH